MKTRTKSLVSLLFASLLLATSPALAGDAEKAAAISAFDEGAALLAKGQTAAACDKFAQSYRLDPQLGSLLHFGDCREKNGQLASAWSAYRDAAEWAAKMGDEREALAAERAAALAPRLTKLLLVLPVDLPAAAVITRAGQPVPEALWREVVPLDPGAYELSVSAEGYETWTGQAVVEGEGTTVEVEVPSLVPTAAPAEPTAEVVPPPAEDAQPSLFARKWPAFAALGVGVVGGVIGVIFSVQSLDAKAQGDELCGVGNPCVDTSGPTDVDLRQKAWDAGTGATVGAVIAGVGFAAAGVLWFVLPGAGAEKAGPTAYAAPYLPRPSQLRIGLHPGGLALRGRW